MNTRGRYFVNKLPDYSGGDVLISKSDWKDFILNLAQNCAERQPCTKKNVDGGLYVGCTGIAYMYYHLSQSPVFQEEKLELLAKGLDIIKKCEDLDQQTRYRDPSDVCSFILGQAGMHAISAVLHEANGDTVGANERLKLYADAASICKPMNFVSFGGDELFVGRAGYICGALWLNDIFKRDVVPKNDLIELCNTIMQSGRQRTRKGSSRSPLMYSYYDTKYFGAAHGVSSIMQMLMSCSSFMESADPETLEEIKETINYLMSLQTQSGNFPCSAEDIGPKSPGHHDLVHWCHGAPGIVYALAKAYLVTKDDKYLQSCIKCAEVTWQKGLLLKGPGICHGVAGSGYVFLLLYRLTNDAAYLHRANEFGKFLKAPEFKQARVPDHPYSLYEGSAGTVCFLVDLLNPHSAAFPFMDIFKY